MNNKNLLSSAQNFQICTKQRNVKTNSPISEIFLLKLNLNTIVLHISDHPLILDTFNFLPISYLFLKIS